MTEMVQNFLKESLFFSGLDDATIKRLSTVAHLHDYEKGKLLFVAGERAQSFFIIRAGWVKLFRETLDGDQAVVDILTARHVFGETSIFENDIYPYSAEVVEPAKIVSIPLSALKNEIENNHAFAVAMLTSMSRYRRQQEEEIEHRTLQNAPQRIGCFLLRLTDQATDGQARVNLPYDKTLVASRLGMQPETFSRALGKLKDATGIRVKGATIEIDKIEELSEFSCSACSSEFPCKDLKRR